MLLGLMLAELCGAGGAWAQGGGCVWYGQVVVNSNNTYRLAATYGQSQV
jgi:hypothetical protein